MGRDAAAAALPFVPGSYACKAGRMVAKADSYTAIQYARIQNLMGRSCANGAGKAVHGNSKLSTKVQHGHEIFEKENGDVVKTGISGRPLNKNGTSPRANSQVNSFNNAVGSDKYGAIVVEPNIPGRQAALDWELNNAIRLWEEGNSMSKHQIPAPWNY